MIPTPRFWDEVDSEGTRWYLGEYVGIPGSRVYGQTPDEIPEFLKAALRALRQYMQPPPEAAQVLEQLAVPPGSQLVSLHVVGSHAHGTHVPPTDPTGTDDIDLLAVYLPPPAFVFGLDRWEGTQQWVGSHDVVAYSLAKLLRLLAKSNPNVLGLLFMPVDTLLYTSAIWERLLTYRADLLTKEAFHSFAGYAKGQLHRMEHNACEGYMGEKRKRLVAQHGYDTKNAAHLLRLLTMCIELMESGSFQVRRPDAEYFKQIKRGDYTLEEIKQKATELFVRAETAHAQSLLPERIDRPGVSTLLTALHFQGWLT